jgi:hypothetical protein
VQQMVLAYLCAANGMHVEPSFANAAPA